MSSIKDTLDNGGDKATDIAENINSIIDYVNEVQSGEATVADSEQLIRDSLDNLVDGVTDVVPGPVDDIVLDNLTDFATDITDLAAPPSNEEERQAEEDFLRSLLDFLKTIDDFFRSFIPGYPDGDIQDMLDKGLNDDFNTSKNWTPPRRDPLAIDLDNDGIETIGADGTVVFDHDGDGVKTGTGWVSADDGLLVLDRNGNDTIDTGAELFGVDTVKADGTTAIDGFDALSDLDSNGDGVFDAQDAEFANVQIWQDADQDGISDTGELTSLTDAGIVSIGLNAESNNVNLGNGNVQTATSAHLTVDGEEGTTGNLDLAHNPFYSEFTGSIPLTEAAQNLPDSRGSGMVRDLREAMSLSSELTSIVSTYAEQTSYIDQRAQLDALVDAWADTSTMQTSIELAQEQNFNLIYMVPGQSVSDFSENRV